MVVCSVYWIRLPEHTDMFSQGYIGVTTQGVDVRFAQHVSVASGGSSLTLSKAIRKHGAGSLVISVLLTSDESYCYEVEAKLRSRKRVGWNIVQGGGKPPLFAGHSEKSKRLISQSLKASHRHHAAVQASSALRRGYQHTAATKSLMQQKASGRLPWETSRADTELWALADKFFKFSQETGMKSISTEKHFGLTKYALNAMYKKFKQGWNPVIDPQWIQWVRTVKES